MLLTPHIIFAKGNINRHLAAKSQ